MGDQSSGKSSVLEQLSGIPFPRGAGLVTRCATSIVMRKGASFSASASISSSGAASASAPQAPTELASLAAIGEQIKILTDKIAGSYSGFAPKETIIEIILTSPDVPFDMTIVDLPGIVRTVVGFQDKDVVKVIDDLLDFYLKQPRTLILAIIVSVLNTAARSPLQCLPTTSNKDNHFLIVLHPLTLPSSSLNSSCSPAAR